MLRLPAAVLVAVALGAWIPATAQALPPIARASATPDEALEGELIAFSSAGSRDPDGDLLTFNWDFGDGITSADTAPSHAYGASGAYDVSLSVSDGRSTAFALLTVHVLAPPSAEPAAASRPMAWTSDHRRLFVVNGDSGSVTEVDAALRSVVREVPVCPQPTSLAISLDELGLYVSCSGSNEVVRLSMADLRIEARVSFGLRPEGLAVSPLDGSVVVAWHGSDRATVLEPDLALRHRIEVGDGPSAVAIDGRGLQAWVTHLLTRGDAGAVSVLDLSAGTVERAISLAEDEGPDGPSSGRGFPNLLGTIELEPSGRGVWVGGLKSNTGRGLFASGTALVPHNRVRGVMLRIDSMAMLEEPQRRIDTNNADRVSAFAFSGTGRYAYTAHPGIGAVSIIDLLDAAAHDASDGSPITPASRIEVGALPNGLLADTSGNLLWVLASLSRELVLLDVADPTSPSIVQRIAVTEEALDPVLALGQRMFFSSVAPGHSLDGYIACASCHPGGGHDGRTWDFTQSGEGLRNTIDLRGRRGMGHGPVHWSANFDEIQDFENDIVNAFGGTGLASDGLGPHPSLGPLANAGRSAELDALAAWVGSLDAFEPSPHRSPDGSLDASALRGRDLFMDPSTQCASCHVPPRFTDSVLTADPADYVLHDVGTFGSGSGMRLGGELTGLDTPTLIGVWDSAPYLHDGRAADLRAVLTTENPADRHGVTSHLSPSQLDDLEHFLLSLDREEGDAPHQDAGLSDAGVIGADTANTADAGTSAAPSSGCSCGVSPVRGPGPLGLSVLVLLLSLAARRTSLQPSRDSS